MTTVSGFWTTYGSASVGVWTTTDEMAAAAATDIGDVLIETVDDQGEANAMFATGNSQLAMLAHLVGLPDVPWARVRIFHMDQYVGIDPEHPASFSRYVRERLSEPVHPMAVHYVGTTPAEATSYASLLQDHPLDACVMGIGENGHLAFNDPAVADFDDPVDVKVVSLDEACRAQQVGEGHFPTLADVPARAITVTIPALLRAGSVFVVCPEARKARAVQAALTGPISTACPASILRRTAQARVYLDADSAQGLSLPAGP